MPNKKLEQPGQSKKTFTQDEVVEMQNQFNNQINQYDNMVKALQKKLQDNEINNLLTRLSVLFDVVKNKESFPDNFVDSCVKEIVLIVNIQDEEVEQIAKEATNVENISSEK